MKPGNRHIECTVLILAGTATFLRDERGLITIRPFLMGKGLFY